MCTSIGLYMTRTTDDEKNDVLEKYYLHCSCSKRRSDSRIGEREPG